MARMSREESMVRVAAGIAERKRLAEQWERERAAEAAEKERREQEGNRR